MNLEQFIKKYNPIVNIDSPNDLMFETYGEELEKVQRQDSKFIWTVIEGDEGFWLTNGFHFVNRWGYVIATREYSEEKPFLEIEW